MKPSMHRKARISNPTFKTSPQYMQQERRNHPPLFYYPSPCPSDAAGALSSRSMASRLYGAVDKAVYALAAGFCVGLDNIFLAFRHSNGHTIKIRSIPLLCTLLLRFRILSFCYGRHLPFLFIIQQSIYLTSRYLHKNLLNKLSNIPS